MESKGDENGENMFSDNGIHATTVSKLMSIKKNGFFESRTGRRGKGVYFWRDSRYAVRIGILWHRYCLNKNQYQQDYDTRCGIIKVMLEVEQSSYLDLERDDIQDAVSAVADRQGIHQNTDDGRISALYDKIITDFEKKANVSFLLLRTKVTVPRLGDETWYSFKALGNPTAYVVRDTNVINIVEYRILNGDDDDKENKRYSKADC